MEDHPSKWSNVFKWISSIWNEKYLCPKKMIQHLFFLHLWIQLQIFLDIFDQYTLLVIFLQHNQIDTSNNFDKISPLIEICFGKFVFVSSLGIFIKWLFALWTNSQWDRGQACIYCWCTTITCRHASSI
jgi:hypothetical protein